MLSDTTGGVFTIAATPFLPDGALDLDSLDRLIAFYAEKGATGLTILGLMGEAGKLSAAEAAAVIDRVIGATDLPVVVGVSAPGLATLAALAATAMDRGAAAVMVAPTANLRTDDQIAGYFRLVSQTLGDTPWVLQDFPLVTGVQIAPGVMRRVFDENPTCVMLKHEDWPGLEKISALRADEAAGARRVPILTGNGGQFLLEEMRRGADGAMTGFAFPEMMSRVVALMSAGEEAHARDVFDAYLPLVRYESQPGLGLAVRKHILARRGVIAHPTARAPAPILSEAAADEVATLIARQEDRLRALGEAVG